MENENIEIKDVVCESKYYYKKYFLTFFFFTPQYWFTSYKIKRFLGGNFNLHKKHYPDPAEPGLQHCCLISHLNDDLLEYLLLGVDVRLVAPLRIQAEGEDERRLNGPHSPRVEVGPEAGQHTQSVQQIQVFL